MNKKPAVWDTLDKRTDHFSGKPMQTSFEWVRGKGLMSLIEQRLDQKLSLQLNVSFHPMGKD